MGENTSAKTVGFSAQTHTMNPRVSFDQTGTVQKSNPGVSDDRTGDINTSNPVVSDDQSR
jgi:hypothetical protein